MAHEIETMAYAGNTPWHGLGVHIGDDNMTSERAIRAAGLDWKVIAQRMFYMNPRTFEYADGTHQAIVRETDGKLLGEVGANMVPVQNTEAFEFMDDLVAAGDLRYHTAGSLRGGKRVWILAQLPGGFTIGKSDRNYPFALLSNRHDGTGCLEIKPTSVRVVCANTLALARADGAATLKIQHTGNLRSKLDKARDVLGLVTATAQAFGEVAQLLATVPMVRDDMRDLAGALVPLPDEAGDRQIARVDSERAKIVELFTYGRGNGLPGVAGTAWAGLNAVTEWTGNNRGIRTGQAARLESAWFGAGDDVNQAAIGWLGERYGVALQAA